MSVHYHYVISKNIHPCHEDYQHPFLISTSFMTRDQEDEESREKVKDDDEDLDTIDECCEYNTTLKTARNGPNKLGDGTIKTVSPETIKKCGPATTSQTGLFLENCSLVMGHQRAELTPGPSHGLRLQASKVRAESRGAGPKLEYHLTNNALTLTMS